MATVAELGYSPEEMSALLDAGEVEEALRRLLRSTATQALRAVKVPPTPGLSFPERGNRTEAQHFREIEAWAKRVSWFHRPQMKKAHVQRAAEAVEHLGFVAWTFELLEAAPDAQSRAAVAAAVIVGGKLSAYRWWREMGRPASITEIELDQIEKLIQSGKSEREAILTVVPADHINAPKHRVDYVKKLLRERRLQVRNK